MKKRLLNLFMFLLLSISQLMAQDRNITGTVTAEEDGLPLPGVSVRIKGQQIGTQTGADGKFSISAPSNSTALEFTYIGYATKEVALGSGNVYNVALAVDSKQLSEVVVTALGVSKSERSIGYSVSKVSGEELVKSGEQNIIQALAAKATGVQITSSSGTPGASSKVVLRGPASFQGDNQPLIVVDGVPINNSVNNETAGDDPYNGNLYGVQLSNRAIDINPEDIESVSILKGPAAAALYGQAAGNGAIIYTTKRGVNRQGIGVTFSSSVEAQTVNKLPKLQSRYGQGSNGVYSAATPNSWGPDLLQTGAPIYDNNDAFFKTGMSYNNNLSLNGGNDVTTFRMSFGSSNIGGIVPNSDFNRYSVRLTGDTELSKRIKVGGTINYVNSNATRMQNGSNLSGIMLPLLRMPVDFNIKNYINEDGTNNNYFANYDNPLFSANQNPYTDETDRVVGNVYTDIKLNDVFALTWRVGSDSYKTLGRQIYAYSSRGNDYGDGSGQVNRTNVSFRNLYTDLLLKFNTKFGANKDFTVSGLVGGNFNYSQFQSSFERGRGIAIPGFYNFSGFSELYVSDNDWYRNNRALFADVTFDYKNIVFLTMTGRNEWSSTFGKNSKGFFYPKADLSYVFSHLLKDQSVVSYGKVRFAYSNVGISPGVYADRTYYSTPLIADGMTNGFSFPYQGQNGYAISSTLYGLGLVPERNVGLEAGLDMRFLDGRIGLDATYYEQKSTDLLISQPVAPTSGFEYKFNNIGKLRNRGIELGINGDIFRGPFSWNAAVNWSKNTSQVLELAAGVTEVSVGSGFSDPQSFAIVGKPFGVFYGAKFSRDASGNLLIDPASGLPVKEATQQELGNPTPDWLMNINNSFSYKNISFSFLWDFRKGGEIWNGTWQNLNFRGRTLETEARDQDYIIPGVYASGPNAGQANTTTLTGFQYFSNYLGGGGSTNELSIQDGSWVRLRSVNLAYRFDLAKNTKSPVQFVEVGASMRNVLLFTDYKGVDPETSLTGSDQNLSGYDYFNNPGTKSMIFNVRVGF